MHKYCKKIAVLLMKPYRYIYYYIYQHRIKHYHKEIYDAKATIRLAKKESSFLAKAFISLAIIMLVSFIMLYRDSVSFFTLFILFVAFLIYSVTPFIVAFRTDKLLLKMSKKMQNTNHNGHHWIIFYHLLNESSKIRPWLIIIVLFATIAIMGFAGVMEYLDRGNIMSVSSDITLIATVLIFFSFLILVFHCDIVIHISIALKRLIDFRVFYVDCLNKDMHGGLGFIKESLLSITIISSLITFNLPIVAFFLVDSPSTWFIAGTSLATILGAVIMFLSYYLPSRALNNYVKNRVGRAMDQATNEYTGLALWKSPADKSARDWVVEQGLFNKITALERVYRNRPGLMTSLKLAASILGPVAVALSRVFL